MLILPLPLPSGEVAVLAPVPYLKLGAYEALRSRLQQHWEASEQCIGELVADETAWVLIKQVVTLLPRLDSPQVGFPLGESYLWLESFLFSDLDALHKVEPVESTERDDDMPPVPSSGDPLADMVADFSFQHGSVSAIALLDRFDLQTINQVVKRSNELARDPEERQQEELAIDYNEWKANNQSAYRQSLGLPVFAHHANPHH